MRGGGGGGDDGGGERGVNAMAGAEDEENWRKWRKCVREYEGMWGGGGGRGGSSCHLVLSTAMSQKYLH